MGGLMISLILYRGFLLNQSLSFLQSKCIIIFPNICLVISNALLYFVTRAYDCKSSLICMF